MQVQEMGRGKIAATLGTIEPVQGVVVTLKCQYGGKLRVASGDIAESGR